jgi:hypothetical protein
VRRIWMTKRELARYTKAFERFLDDLERVCMHHRINYFAWTTDQPFEDTFMSLLSRCSAMAGTA